VLASVLLAVPFWVHSVEIPCWVPPRVPLRVPQWVA